MAATLEIENDAGTPITSSNFGAVNGGAYEEIKFILKNVGDQSATSVQLSIARLAANDGIDFAQIAEDSGGNPDSYGTTTINLGTLAADASVSFWVKITIPTGTTPAGNPRQFDVLATYTGT
jgi:hypothetical protein